MKTTNLPFLLKTVTGMEQIGSDVQKYTGWHLTGLNGFVGPIYDPGFHQPGWLGRCPLGFPWAQGHLCTNSDVTLVYLPSIWARWTRTSVFHWYCHLAAVFSPLVGLENVISHIEDLIKFTQRALSDSSQAIGLLNYEVSMRRAILQSCLALDSLTSSKWASVLQFKPNVVFTHQLNHPMQNI